MRLPFLTLLPPALLHVLPLLVLLMLPIPAVPSDHTVYAAPRQRVDIGGRKLNLVCMGSGAPTVIFDSGLSDWSFSWALVQPQVALQARACSYDRAGLGFSDPSGRASTSANMVADLHRLLQAAGIAPPYLLVGHSLGSLNMRLYASRYPAEVAGMVLVDAIHEDGIARIDAQTGGMQTRYWSAQVAHFRRCAARVRLHGASAAFRRDCIEPDDRRLDAAVNAARVDRARRPGYQRTQLDEASNFVSGVDFAQVRAALRQCRDLPLVVLTAGRSIDDIGPEWLQLQRDLAAQSAAGRQQTVPGAGHYLQLEAPATVVETIGSMIASIRQR